jgi:signal transduction histidine kinase
MERAATGAEREAITRALPPAALGDRGIASVLTELDGVLIDGAQDLATGETFVRSLPARTISELDAWVALLDRRRAQLAHDVSGPATGVLAALETVLEYEPIPESSRSILSDARTGMLRLASMLADRTSAMGARPLTIESLATPIIETLDPYRERLLCTIEGDPPVDVAIQDGALQVLMTNAWKFRRGAKVAVVIRGDAQRLIVEDDGRGADAPTVRRAGELGISSRSSGVGLGLFVIRRAVMRRGGAVRVEASEAGFKTTVALGA